MRLADRKSDDHGGPPPHLGRGLKGAVMHLHDAVHQGETDAGSVGFGRIIELIDLAHVFRRDPDPRVGDVHLHKLPLLHLRRNVHDPALRHGLTGVQHDVEEGLSKQLLVGSNEGKGGVELEGEPDAFLLPFGL